MTRRAADQQHVLEMVGLGIFFGLVVLSAGLLIAFGLILENTIVLGLGFLLLALCAIFGMQPSFLNPRRAEHEDGRHQ